MDRSIESVVRDGWTGWWGRRHVHSPTTRHATTSDMYKTRSLTHTQRATTSDIYSKNTTRYNTQEHLLLTVGLDPYVRLWDLRKLPSSSSCKEYHHHPCKHTYPSKRPTRPSNKD